MMNSYYVYILTNRRNGTLDIGVTNNLSTRIWQHKEGQVEGFTKKYGVHLLVYYEEFNDIREAISREKVLKKWNRLWKLRLIEEMNPEWKNLYENIF